MATSYAIFSAQYRPHVGGIEVFTERLAHELVRTGDKVHIITTRMPGAADHERQADGVEVWRLPSYLLLSGRLPIPNMDQEYSDLYSLLLRLNIDRVLVNTRFYGLSLEGLRFAQTKGIPAVVLDHGSNWLTFGSPLPDVVLHAYERHMTERVKTYKPIFAGISRVSCNWLQTFGINTSVVIPNAVDARKFRTGSTERDFRAELGVSSSDRMVAFVGRLTPEKGALPLAEAAALLGERCIVVMAGEGPQRKAITQLGLRNVHLLGNLNPGDVSALLAQSDLFCLPSRSEGFCLSLIEAGAWGVPAVIPHVGVADDVLGDPPEVGAFLPSTTPTPDEIARTLIEAVKRNDPAACERYRNRIEHDYSWTVTAKALRAAFEQETPHETAEL